MKHAFDRVHFVGVGGSGMSGIAEVMLGQGFAVTGSDLNDSDALRRLAKLGAQVHVGHAAAHLGAAEVVVASAAVAQDNAELVEARARHLPVVPRGLMLAELMRTRQGIAVAGAHGKTTTTALIASVLRAAKLDPGYVMGGVLRSTGTSAEHGTGECMVVESDESDASFLHLRPVLAVVTNIDGDHMETYGHDATRLDQAFVDFLQGLPFYGTAVLCSDDPGVQRIRARLQGRVLSYGFCADADLRAVNVRAVGTQMHFTVQRPDALGTAMRPGLDVQLNLTGQHNVLNALAALAVAQVLHVDDAAALRALAQFQGVGRRFESHGEQPCAKGGRFALIEDYGHHPVEISATLGAVRGAFPGRRVVLAFQPHRFTRTRDCFADFVRVLRQADVLLLTDVYSAGESPIAGASSQALDAALRAEGAMALHLVADVGALATAVLAVARDGDVVLCMGAGSIGEVATQVARMATDVRGTK